MTGLPQPFLAAIGPEIRARHRARAEREIARYLCEAKWTDGFCGGDDPACKCRRSAHGLLASIEMRGCVVVWEYDPAVKAALGL